MKTVNNFILTLLLLITCSLQATAQTEYFYYYCGNKEPLTLNEDKIVINIPKENEKISERISKNVQILSIFEDGLGGVTYFDIFALTRSEYERLTSMDFWKEDSRSVILSNFFFTERHAEIASDAYLNVQLKKAEDEDLLAQYVEKYKLRNLGNVFDLLPLIYILTLTPESEKNSLDIANEMYESGNFAFAVPDFISEIGLDETQVKSIINAASENETGIFDLQGRPIKGTPLHGIYVKDGRKVVR